jgi:hypothetical protein
MSSDQDKQHHGTPTTQLRDPSDWKTGSEPLTTSQKSYIETLATEAGETEDDVDELTKADASIRIEELQEKTGRGQPHKS